MTISVSDPFDAASDPALPTLALALDPSAAKKELKRRLSRLSGSGKLRLQAIRVTRHKPGRRCVVEYDVQRQLPDGSPENLTVIGKVRARRFGNEAVRLLEDFWHAGFSTESPDGISVPEPVGVISRFQMWFQRKVPGQTATAPLFGPDGARLAERVAAAIHKVHRVNVPTTRTHGIADELRILHQCFERTVQARPELALRLGKLREACDRLGASLPVPQVCGIHRDFYAAQVIIDNGRLYLIDFDLYCVGDPALDVGNFIGHMIEEALRRNGNPNALAVPEQALRERFLELTRPSAAQAVEAYTTLTLARHVYLSTVFPDRHAFTGPLLELCESRLN